MAETLRIFCTTSATSALYMSLYARSSRKDEYTDLLLIDQLKLKPSQVDIIRQAVNIHEYKEIKDFSLAIEEGATPVPSRIKQLTRIYKTKPIFRDVYQFLYRFQLKKEARQRTQMLRENLNAYVGSFSQVELYVQPLVHLTTALCTLFPEASLSYFEHGLGDYQDIMGKRLPASTFRCLFHASFCSFLANIKEKNDWVLPAFPQGYFSKNLPQILDAFPQLRPFYQQFNGRKNLALLATQPLEEFRIPTEYWKHFLKLCLSQVDDVHTCTFLIKPHPRQSPESVQKICEFLENRGITYEHIEAPEVRNVSLEILFAGFVDSVSYVFSPYSSSVFYLSVLYPSDHTRYFYSMRSVLDHAQLAPDLYQKRWKEMEVRIREIYGKKAEEL